MKKWLVTGIFVLVAIIATLLVVGFNSYSEEMDEFYAFREFLDEEYTPIFEKTNVHIDKSAEKIDSFQFTNWYLLETGMEENLALQRELENAKEKIINKDLEHADALAYKKNILNQIGLLEEVLNINNDFPSEFDTEEQELFKFRFIEKVDELSKNVEEMNEILGEYFE